ncbi:glycosyltransferase family 4 protein [Streptosporangium saharense]|uniref:glycosyltransferase family 4 protein n=1 Tax=Streptosporangium saharense TaxID=1706840 RepID=UPI0036A4302B
MNGGTVVIAVHDGFYGYGTGAGRCNRALLEAVVQVIAPHVQLIVMPIELVPASPEYDPVWHAASLELVRQVGGHVVPVDNGTGGLRRFADLDGFKKASGSAAQAIAHLAGERNLLVLASDVPFFGLGALVPLRVRRRTVLVAHATAALHDPRNAARISWERNGLAELTGSGGHVAAICGHMRQHLNVAYGLPEHALVDLYDGLTGSEWRIPAPEARLLPAAATKAFLLAYGRAEPYKGWDDLLDALTLLDGNVPHTVLAAVTETDRPTGYQRYLAAKIAARQLDVTLMTRFDSGVRTLLAHPALDAVIVPSRVEPFGRPPLEAFAAGASPVVATTAGGLAELVRDGQTGYSARPADPASLAAAIRRALDADPAERGRLRAAGRTLAATSFDYRRNVREFLHVMAPWVLGVHGSERP